VRDPLGQPAIALIHRPLFPGTRPEEKARQFPPAAQDPNRECIWISFCRVSRDGAQHHLGAFVAHHRLACPKADWERLKIGGGAPPVASRHGWLVLYHGVDGTLQTGVTKRELCYAAGAMILDREHPNRILYRSPGPVLAPAGPLELHGTVESVVFPTGIDRRDDLGRPDRYDVYYGMADYRIGVARLDMPETLPEMAATLPLPIEGCRFLSSPGSRSTTLGRPRPGAARGASDPR
jgi:predicted GH43/DUF377 family glycosyl hydrolase